MAHIASSQKLFTTVRSEGGLLPPDLLARVAANDAELNGLSPEDFDLPKGERVNEAAARAWERVKAYWAAFRAAASDLSAGETGVSETREQWLLPLFRQLGYGRLTFRPAADVIDDRRYAISHQAGDEQHLVPIHLVGFTQDLDRSGRQREAGGPGRTSSHGLMQEYLNRTDCLWGIVSNGLRLRVLRDNQRLSRAAYVEFDLEAMFDGGIYADFVLLYLLVHRSRLPQPNERPERCWLERWREASEARGARALDELSAGVRIAIESLGQGLLEHPANGALREQLQSGELSVLDYYRQLLRLVYRLLFLLAAEDRDLLFEESTGPRLVALYRSHYGVGRLRELVASRRHADRYDDLWRSLQRTFEALRIEATGAKLGLKPLAGGLFDTISCRNLDDALLTNARLLEAIRGLTFTESSGILCRINYRDLNVEELGSVYEGLLEMQPVLQTAGDRPIFDLGTSGERKSTGSYYTPDSLVQELIVSALEPVIAEAMDRGRTTERKRRNLLDLKVCDPACGSGHFLLAAARRIGREIARLDAGESEPDPATARHATREAIAHCIYGVDKNQLAVDLCKLALWLEAHEPGKPIGFLDHHVKWGDSLVGVFDLEALESGIPDDAYTPATGDDRKVVTGIKRVNREERGKLGSEQRTLFEQGETGDILGALRDQLEKIGAMPAETVSDVEAVKSAYRKVLMRHDLADLALACHLWTWAFFAPLHRRDGWHGGLVPTTATVRRVVAQGRGGLHGQMVGKMQADALRIGFFHWPLEFPEVFGRGEPGFDAVLGNPPWERVKLQEKEFFLERSPEIANAPNKAARDQLVKQLEQEASPLWHEFVDAKRTAENASGFMRGSGRFELTGGGDVNLYSVFAEEFRHLQGSRGRAGIIVPTGIATDDTNKRFFADLVERRAIALLLDFENRNGLFPGVHRSAKFSLLGMVGSGTRATAFRSAFFVLDPAELRDPERTFTLTSEQVALVNPNTKTMPLFRTTRDTEITTAIYERVPVLINEAQNDAGNPWGLQIMRVFDLTKDDHLLSPYDESIASRDTASPQIGSDFVPVYEAKMFTQFDHRASDVVTNRNVVKRQKQARVISQSERRDPFRYAVPESMVKRSLVHSRHRTRSNRNSSWLLAFRDITANTNGRTMVAAILPFSGTDFTTRIFFTEYATSYESALIAALNTFVFDYCCRNKLGGLHLSDYVTFQLPVPSPERFGREVLDLIMPRVLELTYTAHDLAPFARECGYDGEPFVWDEERRAHLRAELDGIYAHLYGLSRDDFAYILDTFPIVRRNDEKAFGEYRTKRLCLEAYDYFAPEALQGLDRDVKRIEVALREFIHGTLGGRTDAVPPHLRDKLAGQHAKQSRRGVDANGQPSLAELLQSGYLLDLQDIMISPEVWPSFEDRFPSKSQVRQNFSRLNEVRNPLAHNRGMPEETRRKGEAAVTWFETRLDVVTDDLPLPGFERT